MKTIIWVSLAMFILGIIFRVFGAAKFIVRIGEHSRYTGIFVGSQLGKVLLPVSIWLSVTSWYVKKQKSAAGIILIMISILSLLAGFIAFQIPGL